MTLQFGVIALPVAFGCAAAMHPNHLPDNARCYSAAGIIWPLGSDSAAEAGSHSWLILLPRRQAAYAVDTYGNSYGGSWRHIGGDSVVASLSDGLTVTSLRLFESGHGLSGRAHGISDEMKQDSTGVSVPFEYDWSARFTSLNCRAVPDSLLTHIDAASIR
jgi:hypothetical protein